MPPRCTWLTGTFDSFGQPAWNKREDEYGCQNVENRTRIVREIIEGIREACGPDFCHRLPSERREFHPTKQGITAEQAAENARALWRPRPVHQHRRIRTVPRRFATLP